MENSYAEKVISPYRASMDPWLSGSACEYQDFLISYYSLGHRLGLYLDLTLRAGSSGIIGLDDASICIKIIIRKTKGFLRMEFRWLVRN